MRARHTLLATLGAIVICGFAALVAPRAAGQARVLGSGDCEKCHKPAIKKWKVDEPAQYGAKAHFNTNKQLTAPNAAKYAAAIGLANPADPNGRCAACHATVVRGMVRSGVSCEHCHGPASQWNPVHDKEPLAESYKKSIPLGLRDLHAKPAAIAKLCVDCHVTPEKALAAAGHPNGAGFKAGESLKKLVHWTEAFTGDGKLHATYDYGQVEAAAGPLVQKALAGGGGSTRRADTAPPPTSSGGRTTPPATRPSTGGPAAAPAPWDWDQPLPELPSDFGTGATAPAPPPVAPSNSMGSAAPPAPPPPQRSIVVDQPVIPQPALTTPKTNAPPSAGPRSTVSEIAELRGRAADLLATLLASRSKTPTPRSPAKPGEFKGPDGELMSLQDAALYLALETLRKNGAQP